MIVSVSRRLRQPHVGENELTDHHREPTMAKPASRPTHDPSFRYGRVALRASEDVSRRRPEIVKRQSKP